MSQAGANTGGSGSSGVTQIDGDTGSATPTAGVINIVGDSSGIDTSATGDTLTVSFDITEQPAIPTSVATDSGSATPALNALTIAGGNNISTSGASDTVTINVAGTTQYNVQVGAASGALVSVAPSATSGVPLISQGSSANPAFGTSVVAGGGTGNTTFTPYSVITAGTTATGAFQNVSGVGTSGQVLTSNGAAALPTWQDAAGGGGAAGQYTSISIWDDFMGDYVATNNAISTLGWGGTVSSGSVVLNNTTIGDVDSGHPGVVSVSTGISSSSGRAQLEVPDCLILGGGAITATFLIKQNSLSTASQTSTTIIGFTDGTASASPSNGVYFSYTDSINSGQWVVNCVSSSTATTGNTANTVDTNWHKLEIRVNAAATSVSFYIDDVEVSGSPITTNIPSVLLGPHMGTFKSNGTGTSRVVSMDLYTFEQTLTASRY